MLWARSFVFLGVLPSGVLFEAKTWDLPLMGIVAVLYAIFSAKLAALPPSPCAC